MIPHETCIADGFQPQEMKLCTVFIKFYVTHEMAPFSRLLGYYIRADGEAVADSIVFNVEPTFKNRVSGLLLLWYIITCGYHFYQLHYNIKICMQIVRRIT